MSDLRFIEMPNGKKWYKENTVSKNMVFKDTMKDTRDKKAMEQVKRSSRLPMFGDADGDKILNAFDKEPFKKNKRSKWGLLLK